MSRPDATRPGGDRSADRRGTLDGGALAMVLVAGCGGAAPNDAPGADAPSPGADAASMVDAGFEPDAASVPDDGPPAEAPPLPTTPDTTPPTRPGGNGLRFDGMAGWQGGVHATSLDSSSVDVHWWASVDDVGVARYCVLRADGDAATTPDFVEVGCVAGDTTWVDTTVTSGALYTYAAVAEDFAGNRSPWSLSSGHDGIPRVLAIGMTRSITIDAPASVPVGGTIEVRRQVTCSPACNFGHNDLHATLDLDIAYLTDPRLPTMPPGSWDAAPFFEHDFVFSFTAPSSPGALYFYPEAHFSAVNGWNPVDADGFDQGLTHPWIRVEVAGASPLDIDPPSLPPAAVGTPYSASLTAVGDSDAPTTFGVLHGGWLPTGLRLSGDGAITGTPGTPGRYDFRVRVEDAAGTQATRGYSLTVAP